MVKVAVRRILQTLKDAPFRRIAFGDPKREIRLGADQGHDAADFIKACEAMPVTPHVGQKNPVADRRSPRCFARVRVMPCPWELRREGWPPR